MVNIINNNSVDDNQNQHNVNQFRQLEQSASDDEKELTAKSLIQKKAHPDLNQEQIEGHDPKLFAHIHLGASANDTGLEGLNSWIPIDYLSKVLATKFPDEKEILSLLRIAKEIGRALDSCIGKQDLDPYREVVEDVALMIWDLQPGKSLLTTTGYRGEDAGHTIYVEWHRNNSGGSNQRDDHRTYDCFVYDGNPHAGRGSLIGPNKKKILPFHYYQNIPCEKLFFSKSREHIAVGFFYTLFAVNDFFKHNKYKFSDTSAKHFWKSLESLSAYQTSPKPEWIQWATPQRSGVCSWRSLGMTLRSIFVRQYGEMGVQKYKALMFHARLHSLVLGHQNFTSKGPPNPFLCHLLLFAAENLCRLVGKESAKNNPFLTKKILDSALATARDLIHQLECVRGKQRNLPLAVGPPLSPQVTQDKKITGLILDSLEELCWKENNLTSSNNIDLSTPSLDTSLIETGLTLLEKLEKIEDCDEKIFIIQLERMLESLPLSSHADYPWEHLNDDEAESILNILTRISERYYTYVDEHSIDTTLPQIQNSLITISIIAFALAKQIDRTHGFLNNYTIPFGIDLVKRPDGAERYYVPHFKRYQELMRIARAFSNYCGLIFQFNHIGVGRSYFIDGISSKIFTKSPDFQFYHRIFLNNKNVFNALNRRIAIYRKRYPFNFTNKELFLMGLYAEIEDDSDKSTLCAWGLDYIIKLKRISLNLIKLLYHSEYCYAAVGDYQKGLEVQYNGKWGWLFFEGRKKFENFSYDDFFQAIPKNIPSENRALVKYTENRKFPPRWFERSLCRPKLQCEKIITFLIDHLDQLSNEDFYSNASICLYKVVFLEFSKFDVPLFEELKNQVSFRELCRDFIHRGIEHSVERQPRKKPDVTLCSNVVTLYQEFKKHLVDLNVVPTSNFQLDSNGDVGDVATLLQWISHPDLDGDEKAIFHLHIVAHFMIKGVVNLVDQDWELLYKSWAHVQIYQIENSSSFSRIFFEEIKRWILNAELTFGQKIVESPSFGDKVAKAVITDQFPGERKNIDRYKLTQRKQQSTFRFSNKSGEQFWEVNITEGTMANQHGIAKLGTLNLNSNQMLKRLFRGRSQQVRQTGGVYHFNDSLWGKIRIYADRMTNYTNGVEREIEGQWCQFLSRRSLMNKRWIPEIFIADCTHWLGKEGLFIDHVETAKRIAIVNSKGEFLDTREEGRAILLEIASNVRQHALSLFEFDGFVLIQKGDHGREKLVLLRYLTASKVPLTFDYDTKEANWIYTSNPNYYLSQCRTTPLGYFRNYLSLQHRKEKGRQKLLVPFKIFNRMREGYDPKVEMFIEGQQIHADFYKREPMKQIESLRFLEIDFEYEKLVCRDLEAKLFLAYLFLAQKDYERSFEWLSELSVSEVLSNQSLILLQWIINSGIQLSDVSPNAEAIRLHAEYFIRYLRPEWDFPVVGLESRLARYLDGLNHVYASIKLPQEMELLLLALSDSETFTHRITLLKQGSAQSSMIQPKVDLSCYRSWMDKPLSSRTQSPFFKLLHEGDIKGIMSSPEVGRWTNEVVDSDEELLFPLKEYTGRELFDHYETLRTGTASENASLIHQLQMMAFYEVDFWILHIVAKYPHRAPPLLADDIFKWLRNLWSFYFFKLKNNPPKPNEVSNSSKTLTLVSESASTRSLSDFYHRLPERLPNFSEVNLATHNPDDLFKLFVQEVIPNSKKISVDQEYKNFFDIERCHLNHYERQFYSTSITEECRIYAEKQQVGALQNREQLIFEPLSKAAVEKIQVRLEEMIVTSKALCHDLEALLMKRMRQAPIENDPRRLEFALRGGKLVANVTLLDTIRALSYGSAELRHAELIKLNPHLTAQDELVILEIARHLLLEKTVLQHLKRVQAVDPSDGQQICSVLASKREYLPEDHFSALVFEWVRGIRLRKEQAILIETIFSLLFEHNEEKFLFGIVFQLMMGEGKTSVILSQLMRLVSHKGRVPLFLCHHSQFSSVHGNIVSLQKTCFGQEVIPITSKSRELKDLKELNRIYEKLQLAEKKQHSIIMKTPTLMMFSNEFHMVLGLYVDSPSSELKDRLQILSKILLFIKENCIGLLDEVDSNLSILFRVNTPVGSKMHVGGNRIYLVKLIYHILSTTPQLKSLVGLRQGRQGELTAEDYREKVLPLLARSLSEEGAVSFKLHSEKTEETLARKESFVRFVQGITDEKKDSKFLNYITDELYGSSNKNLKEAANQIALAKELLTDILPLTLSKSCNRHYGRELHTCGDHERIGKVIPYLSVGVPATTEFGYVYEALCYQFQTALNQGISQKQLYLLAKKMIESAYAWGEKDHIPFDETPEAIGFLELTGISLHDIEIKEKLAVATRVVNSSAEKLLEMEADTAAYHVAYHSQFISCSVVALVDMLKQAIACSGTVWNQITYNKKMQNLGLNNEMNDLFSGKGTEGRVIDCFMRRCREGQSNVYKVSDDKIETILGEVLSSHPKKEKVCVLADCGGLMKSYDNHKLAEKILDYYKNHTHKKIEGVLYMHRDKNCGEENFAILKRGQKPLFIRNTSIEEVTKYGVGIDQLFFYYDEMRTIGTDFPLPKDAVMLVTIDPHQLLVQKLVQTLLRCRGFFFHQTADLVILERSSAGLIDKGESVEGVFLTGVKNQGVLKAKQTLRAHRDKIHNDFYQIVNDSLLKNALNENWEELKKKGEGFASLILNDFEDEPFKKIKRNVHPVSSKEWLKGYQAWKEEQFKSFGANAEEITAAEQSVEQTLGMAQQDLSLPDLTDGFYQESAQGSNIEISVEQDTDTHEMMELEQDLLTELDSYERGNDLVARAESRWALNDHGELIWPEVFALKQWVVGEHLKSYKVDYSECFPDTIFATKNFLMTAKSFTTVFSKIQKPAEQIFVEKSDSGKLKFTLLSLKDADYIKDYLENREGGNAWLINNHGVLLQSICEPMPTTDDLEFYEELKKGLWYINFFNGRVDLLIKDEYLTEELLRMGNTELMLRYLKLKTYREEKMKRIFWRFPLFHRDKDGEVNEGVAVRFSQRSQLKNHSFADLMELTNEEVAQFPVAQCRYLPPEKIPFLSKKEQIKHLPDFLIAAVSVAHVKKGWVPFPKIKYLKTKEQIQALGQNSDLLRGLCEQQIPLVDHNQIPFLNDSQIQYLIEKQVCQLSQKQMKFIVRKQVPWVEPEKINHVPKALMKYIKSAEQIHDLELKYYVELVEGDAVAAIPTQRVDKIPQAQWKALLGYLKDPKNPSKNGIALVHAMDVEKVLNIDVEFGKFFSEDQLQSLSEMDPFPEIGKKFVQQLSAKELVTLHPPLVRYIPDDKLHNKLIILTDTSKGELEGLGATSMFEALSDTSIFEALVPHLTSDQVKSPLLLVTFISYLSPQQLKEIPINSLYQLKDVIRQKQLKGYCQLNPFPENGLEFIRNFNTKLPIPHLTEEHVRNLEPQDTQIIQNLSDSLIQYLPNHLLCKLPENPASLRKVHDSRLHHLSISQISTRNFENRKTRLQYQVQAVCHTLVAPITLVAQLIYDLVRVIFKLFKCINLGHEKDWAELRKISKEAFSIHPRLRLITPIGIWSPEKYLQLKSKILSKTQAA